MQGKIAIESPRDEEAFKHYDVPGDGSCLWHTLCALSVADDPQPRTVAEGIAFKQHMLATMGQDPNRHAILWGCQEGGVRSAIGDWSPHAAWADARAILSTAAHFERNALVVDLEVTHLCLHSS